MNLKQNKGYVGTDIAIAVIILLILIPTIMGMTFNANASKNATNVKAGATNVAVNTIEAAKGIGPGEDLTIENIRTALDGENEIYNGNVEQEDPSNDNSPLIITTDKGTYKVNIEITDYADGKGDDTQPDLVKTVKVTVTFKAKNQQQSIELSTVIS